MKSPESEKSILGAVLLNNKALYKVADIVRSDKFLNPINALIWSEVYNLIDGGNPADLVTVTAALNGQHSLYLGELVNFVPTAANIRYYAEMLHGEWKERQVTGLTEIFLSDETADEKIESTIKAISEIQAEGQQKNTGMRQALNDAFKQIEQRYRSRGQLLGISTTIPSLDKETLGFCNGDLVIIAGRPGMGKSAYMLQVCKENGRGLVVSLEMTTNSLVNRMLAAESGVGLHKLRSGNLEAEDFSKLQDATGRLADHGIEFYAGISSSISDIKSNARREHIKKPLNYLAVDYIGLLSGEAENRVQQVSMFSRELKSLALELNIPVIALSQLNRGLESRPDKTPILSDLRESGSIEQDADKVIFVYRPSYYCLDCKQAVKDGKGDCGKHSEFHTQARLEFGYDINYIEYAKLILAKHREGEPMDAKTYFKGAQQRFIEIERNKMPEPGRLAGVHHG